MDADNAFLFATGNSHKAREFESLLDDFLDPVWTLYDLSSWPEQIPEVVEDRGTFVGNAVKKAVEVSVHTGAVSLSDDSGLVVDALDGEPGVRSARWSGEDATDQTNNEKLVRQIRELPEGERTAHYACVACLAIPGTRVGHNLLERAGIPRDEVGEGNPTAREATLVNHHNRVVIWFEGTVDGRIVEEPRGEHGFGYDPHFFLEEFGETMAELSPDQKNEISHRADALRKLAEFFPGHP